MKKKSSFVVLSNSQRILYLFVTSLNMETIPPFSCDYIVHSLHLQKKV